MTADRRRTGAPYSAASSLRSAASRRTSRIASSQSAPNAFLKVATVFSGTKTALVSVSFSNSSRGITSRAGRMRSICSSVSGGLSGSDKAAAVIAAACGPLPLALCWDWSGSYAVALILFGVLPLLSAVAVVTARRPE